MADKPTELADWLINSWKGNIRAKRRAISIKGNNDCEKEEAEIDLMNMFVEQLELLRPYVQNGLDYDAYHERRLHDGAGQGPG